MYPLRSSYSLLLCVMVVMVVEAVLVVVVVLVMMVVVVARRTPVLPGLVQVVAVVVEVKGSECGHGEASHALG